MLSCRVWPDDDFLLLHFLMLFWWCLYTVTQCLLSLSCGPFSFWMLVIWRGCTRSLHALLYGMGEDLPDSCQRTAMESPHWFMSGFFLLLMLKNSKCSLFVGRYRLQESMWSGSPISVKNRGEREVQIPSCFILYSELRYLWEGHFLPKDCTYTGVPPDVGLGMCCWNTACSCSETVWQWWCNLFFC